MQRNFASACRGLHPLVVVAFVSDVHEPYVAIAFLHVSDRLSKAPWPVLDR